MTKKYKLSLLLLAGIFFLGLALRLYRLNLNVPELYADEVGHYYYFQHLQNHTVSLVRQISYLFFTSTWFFDLTPLGVRLPSAIFGAFTILAGFFFASSLSKKSGTNLYLRVGLAFAFLIATLPWNYSISRLGHTHISILVLACLIHLFLYLRSSSNVQKIISFIPFIVGAYYYPSLVLMSPLVLIIPAKELLWDNKKHRKTTVISGLIFLSITLWFLVSKYQVFNPSSRGLDLAIWRDVNVTADSNLYRGIAKDSQPSLFSFTKNPEDISNKLLFNYPLSVAKEFAENYLSFFEPSHLFLKGDPILRHSTSMVGSIYLFLLPFLVYGIYKFYSENQPKNLKLFITLWALASPIPAAITKDGSGYLLRSITLYIFLTYFCALGLVFSYNFFKTNFSRLFYSLALALTITFSCFHYFYGYFHVYPTLAASSFEYGFKSLSDFQKLENSTLLITWEDKYPYEHFCFWQKLPYETCDQNKTNTRELLGETRVDLPIEKVLFSLPKNEIELENVVGKYQPEYIALSSRFLNNYPTYFKDLKLVREIKNPDTTTSFFIYKSNLAK